MGGGCSTESSTEVRCSFAGHKDETAEAWRAQLLADIGRDPTGVTRDFPRTQLYVAAPKRNNYCRRRQDHVKVLVLDDPEAEKKYFAERNDRVCESLQLLMELCGEDTTAVKLEWDRQQEGASDPSALLMTVLLECRMMRAVLTDNQESAVANNVGAANNDSAGGTSDAPTYTIHSKALRLMQYMVQSVAFFSTRYVIDALRFPWCKHMQDVSWVVHVYPETNASGSGASGEELVILRHMHTLRHYVEANERSTLPRFEIDWVCIFCIDPKRLLGAEGIAAVKATFAPDGEVRRLDGEVLAARLESPNCKLCRVTSAWKKRRRELERRLLECFGVELTESSSLQDNGPFSVLNGGQFQ